MNRDGWKTLKKNINDIATFVEIFPFPNNSICEVWPCIIPHCWMCRRKVCHCYRLVTSPCICILQELVVPCLLPSIALKELILMHERFVLWNECFHSTHRISSDLCSISGLQSAFRIFWRPWKFLSWSCLMCWRVTTRPEIRFCIWPRRSLFHNKYLFWLLLGKMTPPCDNGSCWWRWPFGTYNVGVRLDCIFCASEILGVLFFFYFSVGSHRRAENMIASTSWKASKLLKASRGDDFFLCLQIWPLPAFHLDPRAAKWHLSTRGHVGHFLLLSTKRETERFPKQTPFQNGTLHWLPQPLPWHQGCWGKACGRASWQQ